MPRSHNFTFHHRTHHHLLTIAIASVQTAKSQRSVLFSPAVTGNFWSGPPGSSDSNLSAKSRPNSAVGSENGTRPAGAFAPRVLQHDFAVIRQTGFGFYSVFGGRFVKWLRARVRKIFCIYYRRIALYAKCVTNLRVCFVVLKQ